MRARDIVADLEQALATIRARENELNCIYTFTQLRERDPYDIDEFLATLHETVLLAVQLHLEVQGHAVLCNESLLANGDKRLEAEPRLRLLGGQPQPRKGHRMTLPEVDAVLLDELLPQPRDEQLVEVVAGEPRGDPDTLFWPGMTPKAATGIGEGTAPTECSRPRGPRAAR